MLQFLGDSVSLLPACLRRSVSTSISVHRRHCALTRCLGDNTEPPVHQPPPIACFHRNTDRASDAWPVDARSPAVRGAALLYLPKWTTEQSTSTCLPLMEVRENSQVFVSCFNTHPRLVSYKPNAFNSIVFQGETKRWWSNLLFIAYLIIFFLLGY